MSKIASISRPYAKAAFAVAQSQDALEAWSALFAQWALVAEDKVGAAYLKNPTILVAQKVDFLKEWLNKLKAEKAVKAAAINFLNIIATGRRLSLLAEIALQFEALKRKALNQLLVQVTSSETLGAHAKKELINKLEKRFSKSILLEEKVDPSLLAGVLILAEDLFIDASVRGKLDHLAQAMKMRVG
jgi:F-type H+-transporting ATPase subunit delta